MRTVNSVILHYSYSDDVSAATIDGWHRARGWNGCGYHYVVRKDGKVENGRPVETVGAHCYGFNTNSIGICLTGSDKMLWYPSAAQYDSLQTLLQDLMKRFNIPSMNIFFHREKKATSCPGRLDKTKILGLIGKPVLTPRVETAPTVRRGSKGAAVRELQKRLCAHRVKVVIDGDFGPATETGVRLFQQAHGLDVDGIVGPKTWAVLNQPPG
jgi:N-acetyl-anhydromuramyl-L-alanine amidase AmpD